MLESVSLASGSDGNSLLVFSRKTNILLDAGISPAEMTRKLKYLGIDPKKLDALFISHEHNDHSRGAFDFARRWRIPVYLNQATLKVLKTRLNPSEVEIVIFDTGSPFKIRDLVVKSFPVYHDASEPVGFSVRHKRWKIAYLVDLGKISEENEKEINSSHLVIINSNYDRVSLLNGKYHYRLKERIINRAHLSNETVGNIILNHPNRENTEFWLAHLSEENNSPEIASITVNYILGRGSRKKSKANFKVLPRNRIGPRWTAKEDAQMFLPLAGITLPVDLSNYRSALKEDKVAYFDQNFQRAQEIPLSDIQVAYVSATDNGTGWKITGVESESYVVARDIDIVGIEGVPVADKIWTCECGDFLFRCQKAGIPCKHIIRIIEWLTKKVSLSFQERAGLSQNLG